MDTIISLDIDFRLNEEVQLKKFVALVTIFYDYFDNGVLVERAKKNIKFTVMTEQGGKEGNFVSISFFSIFFNCSIG